jgi:hypothetical protein
MASSDFIQQQMEENFYLANQAERMRLVVAISNVVFATALQISIGMLGLERRALPLTGWMICLGIYGVFAGMKLYERENYHRLRVRKLRGKLNDLYTDAELEKLFKEIEQEHRQIYPRLMDLRLNTILIALHALIALLGVIYSIFCLL